MKKNISILGSTGSVGLSTLKIIDKKKNFFRVILLAATLRSNFFKLISLKLLNILTCLFLNFFFTLR